MDDSHKGLNRLMKPIVIAVVDFVYNIVMLKTSWIDLTNLIFYGLSCLFHICDHDV